MSRLKDHVSTALVGSWVSVVGLVEPAYVNPSFTARIGFGAALALAVAGAALAQERTVPARNLPDATGVSS